METENAKPELIEMAEKDPFARLIGAELLELRPGYAKVRVKTEPGHNNFLGFVHGGVIFGLLDYAFSAASNSHDRSAVAVSMSVQFVAAPAPGDEIFAEAREIARSRKLGLYEMTVTGPDGALLAKSDGRVYRIGKPIVGGDEEQASG